MTSFFRHFDPPLWFTTSSGVSLWNGNKPTTTAHLPCKFLANAHARIPGSCSEDPLSAPSYEELSGKMSMRSSADKGANCFLGYTQNSIYQTLKRGVNPTVFIMGCTLLEHCVQFWAPQFKRDVKVLERIQKKVTKGWEECPTRSS